MTITESIDSGKPSENLICLRCSALLPPQANFCSVCGERINKEKNKEEEALPENGDHEATEELIASPIPIDDIHAVRHTRIEKMDASTRIFDKQTIRHPWLLAHRLVDRFRNDSLVRNSIYIMTTTFATGVIGYFYWLVATHLYSVHDVGLASAFLAVMGLTSTLANLGIGSTLIQMLPRREAGYAWSLTLNAGLMIGTLSGLLAGTITVMILPLFSHQFGLVWHNAAYALLFIVGVPLSIIGGLVDQVFVAERAAGNLLVENVAGSLLKFPLMILLVGAGVLGLFSSPMLAVVATLIGASLLLVPRLGRRYCLAVRGIREQVRNMLSSLAGNHFTNLGAVLPAYLMPVFVTIRLSAVDNGYYAIGGMLTSFFFIVSPAVASALFAEGSHTPQNVLRKARTSAGIISLLLTPAMLISFLGGPYILLLFGPRYAQHSLPVLMIFTISAVPDAITNIYVSVLRVEGRLRHAVQLNLGMAGLNIALAWILLPILGIAGPPSSFLIAQVVGSLVAGVDFIRIGRQSRRSASQSDSGNAEMQNPY